MMISTLEAASLKKPRTYPAGAGVPQPTFADVVDAIFGQTDPRSIHVTSFTGDPHNKDEARWNGQRLSGRTAGAPRGGDNSFICLGVLDPDIPGRSLANVIGHVAFWMDDVGTKTDRQKVQDWIDMSGLKPTLIVETSPGNFSYLWALKQMVPADGGFDDQTVAAVRAKMKAEGLGDPVVATDAARYMRSGFGVNGKAAYRQPDGSPWQVRIATFNPAAKVSLDTFAESMIGPNWRDQVASGAYLSSKQIVAQGGPSERNASMDDPLVKLAALVGLDPQPSTRAGVISAHCPNEANHTGGDPTGYDFINRGMSYCNHASCAHLKSPDFQAMIEDRYDKMIADGLADGSICESPFEDGVLLDTSGEKLRPTARTFLAAAAFDGVDKEEAEAEAERIVAAKLDTGSSRTDEKVGEAERLLRTLVSAGAQFFHSQDDRPYMSFQGSTLPVGGEAGWRPVLRWLRSNAKVPTGNARTTLQELMAAEAFAGPKVDVWFRIGPGPSGAAAYVNLMDKDGLAVEVTPKGWRIAPLADFPVRMTNRAGALPMPQPVGWASPKPAPLSWMDRHFNLPSVKNANDPADLGVQARAGLLMFLMAQFQRLGATPHLLLNGPQGSGKTSFARRLKWLTDNDSVQVVPSLPSDPAALFAVVREQTSVVLDNASKARGDEADLWCALATGGGHQTRMLYTNSERSIVNAKVSLIFTSIREDFVHRADLMDRTVTITLLPLSWGGRRTEQELDAAWSDELPYILGELFDLLADALAIEDGIRTAMQGKQLPRLADAAILAESAARAAGWPAMLCMDALNAMRSDAADKQLSEDAVALHVRALLQAQSGRWSGTTEELLRALNAATVQNDAGELPHSPRGLTAALDRLDGPLRDSWGISRTRTKRGPHGRIIELSLEPTK